jgi:sec-independent protein translocase protein TatA
MPSSLGPAEILVILVVALIVLGPKKLPEAGRQVGKALTEIRRWTQDVKSAMQGAFQPEPPGTQTPAAAPVFDPMPSPMPSVPPPDADGQPGMPKLTDAPTAPIEEALMQPPPAAPVQEPADTAGVPAPDDPDTPAPAQPAETPATETPGDER